VRLEPSPRRTYAVAAANVDSDDRALEKPRDGAEVGGGER
jgi:hypothetical protein